MDTVNFFQLLGTNGSIIMCASSVPQLIKTYRTKCITGLSGTYLAILMIGMSLILSYALYVKNIVFIFGNSLSLTLTGLLVAMWFRYKKNHEKTTNQGGIEHGTSK
ncbi:MAG: PQ-loop repeat-containing protein [Pseudomonadota bacterium]|nr:PQ-loop repeat-containing protein [Pseudomonadota bacterium]